jgi:hypothetical protein
MDVGEESVCTKVGEKVGTEVDEESVGAEFRKKLVGTKMGTEAGESAGMEVDEESVGTEVGELVGTEVGASVGVSGS